MQSGVIGCTGKCPRIHRAVCRYLLNKYHSNEAKAVHVLHTIGDNLNEYDVFAVLPKADANEQEQ